MSGEDRAVLVKKVAGTLMKKGQISAAVLLGLRRLFISCKAICIRYSSDSDLFAAERKYENRIKIGGLEQI